MISFSGQRILVIGGTSGIGFATAKLAQTLGGSITVASRSRQKVDAAVAAFFRDGKVYDHVVVTGSEVTIAPVRELPLDVARAAFDSKFWGFYRVARAAHLRPGGSLSVVAGFRMRYSGLWARLKRRATLSPLG